MHACMDAFVDERKPQRQGPVGTATNDSSGRNGHLSGKNAWEWSHNDNRPAQMTERGALFMDLCPSSTIRGLQKMVNMHGRGACFSLDH